MAKANSFWLTQPPSAPIRCSNVKARAPASIPTAGSKTPSRLAVPGKRPKLYDFFFDRVEPLVPRDLRFGMTNAPPAAGEILAAPLRGFEIAGIPALRHSNRNPSPFAAVLIRESKERIKRSPRPSNLSAFRSSISHQILPRVREYERHLGTL